MQLNPIFENWFAAWFNRCHFLHNVGQCFWTFILWCLEINLLLVTISTQDFLLFFKVLKMPCEVFFSTFPYHKIQFFNTSYLALFTSICWSTTKFICVLPPATVGEKQATRICICVHTRSHVGPWSKLSNDPLVKRCSIVLKVVKNSTGEH